MKKLSLYIVVLFGIQMTFTSCGYNDMVSKRELADKQWSNVESAYQRRLDLIDNLVNTVKGEAKFEQETLTQIVEARASATKMTIDPSKSTPEQLAKWQESQGQLGAALGKLISISENYPNLKANESFKELRDQVEGTENRINTERNRFNEAVADYNVLIKSIPQNIYAGWFGFTSKQGFAADKAAATAPKVDFSDKK
jgi:LemA protein